MGTGMSYLIWTLFSDASASIGLWVLQGRNANRSTGRTSWHCVSATPECPVSARVGFAWSPLSPYGARR